MKKLLLLAAVAAGVVGLVIRFFRVLDDHDANVVRKPYTR